MTSFALIARAFPVARIIFDRISASYRLTGRESHARVLNPLSAVTRVHVNKKQWSFATIAQKNAATSSVAAFWHGVFVDQKMPVLPTTSRPAGSATFNNDNSPAASFGNSCTVSRKRSVSRAEITPSVSVRNLPI